MKTNRGTVFGKVYSKIAIGVFAAIVILVTGSALLTSMVLSGKMQENFIVIGNIASAALASFFGSCIAIGKGETKKLLIALATGTSIIVVLLMITALLFDGEYEGILSTIIPVLISSLLAPFISSDRKKGKNRSRLKKRYR